MPQTRRNLGSVADAKLGISNQPDAKLVIDDRHIFDLDREAWTHGPTLNPLPGKSRGNTEAACFGYLSQDAGGQTRARALGQSEASGPLLCW